MDSSEEYFETRSSGSEDSEHESIPDSQPGFNNTGPTNGVDKHYGNIKVSVVKAEIADVQVDAIVNSTSPGLKLEQGIASKALAAKAGSGLQQDCSTKYPQGISPGEIAVTDGFNLYAGNVYHVTLPKWDGNSVKNQTFLSKLVEDCLIEASGAGLGSIAFPALGTGSLGYPKDVVAKAMFAGVENFQKQQPISSVTDVQFVIYSQDQGSYRAFSSQCGAVASAPNTDERTVVSVLVGKLQVDLIIGNLGDQMCDIIMLTCTTKLDLKKGTLSDAISSAAGPSMQPECSSKYPNGITHGELAVVGPGKLTCKAVYLGALPRYDKPGPLANPEQVLSELVLKSLEKASQNSHTSVCFPTLGAGFLKYPGHIAAKTMLTAIKDFSTNNADSTLKKVVIVIHKDVSSVEKNLEPFTQACGAYPSPTKAKPAAANPQKSSLRTARGRTLMDFFLKPKIDTESSSSDSESFKCEPVLPVKIPRAYAKQKHSRSSAFTAELNAKLAKGKRPVIAPKPSPRFPRRYTQEYCQQMAKQTVSPPSYWTEFTSNKTVDSWISEQNCDKYKLVDVDPGTFDEINRLVNGTWIKEKMFLGRDAHGLDMLNYSTIKVTKIQRVENVHLYRQYCKMQQTLFQCAGTAGLFKQLSEISSSNKGSLTFENLSKEWRDRLHGELNECFYFHGTKAENIQGLVNTGLDPQLANKWAVFGKAIYMAESSTKADQYADERKGPRRKNNLTMFLVRSCLGNICLLKAVRKLKQPPCTDLECNSDECDHTSRHHSVVEEEKYIFREFVIYDGALVYPEYMITYERV